MSARRLGSTIRGHGSVRNFVEDQWVCQMEGILLKRGQGYKGDESKTKKAGGGGIVGWLKNRRGTLIKKGSSEKKRYFELVTMAADADDNPPKAELRYYAKNKPDGTPKGIVNLSSDMRVELLNHSTVCLITTSRTFFIRPMGKSDDDALASSRITAGKWIHCLEFAIEGLRAYEIAGSTQARQLANPVMRMSVNFSAEDMAKERERLLRAKAEQQAAGQGEVPQEQDVANPPEAPVLHDKAADRKLLQQNQEGFENLWDQFGIHAYNALIAHYGPVQIELKRLLDHIKVRVELVSTELSLFKKQNYKSHQVAANEQKTSAIVLKGLYKSVERRSEKVDTHLELLKSQVLSPLEDLIKALDEELDRVVNYNSGTTKTIERLQNGYTDIQENIIEIQTQIKVQEAALEEIDKMTDEQAQKAAVKKAKAVGASFKGSYGSKGSVVTADDIETLESDLATAQGMLVDCKANMRREEKKHTAQMKQALQSLQSLEIRRLQVQVESVKKLQELEARVFVIAETFFDDNSSFIQDIDAIDPVADLQATSERLLRDAKLYNK